MQVSLAEQIDQFGADALRVADERNLAIAALRKIANWKGYRLRQATYDEAPDDALTEAYERGANDMLETLATMARDALAQMGLAAS
jgi:hypothetical protein